jgi:hypothetical protein
MTIKLQEKEEFMHTKKSKQCPICGNDNGCEINENKPCWCLDVLIPRKLIERVEKNKYKSCICKKCIEAFKKHEVQYPFK